MWKIFLVDLIYFKLEQFPIRLDCVLVKLISKYSRMYIKKLIISGKVKVNNKLVFLPKKKFS